MKEKRKGLLVNVLRIADGMDCTKNGVSSRYTTFLLVGEGIDGVFEEIEEIPVLKVVKRVLWEGKEKYHAVPAEGSGYSFGGNFCYSCDGRFIFDYPLPIYDRLGK